MTTQVTAIFLKTLSIEFVKQVDIVDALLYELLKETYQAQNTLFLQMQKVVNEDNIVKLSQGALPDITGEIMLKLMTALTRSISLMCLMKVIQQHNLEDARAKFMILFITRLKSLNFPYFEEARKEIEAMEARMRIDNDLFKSTTH